MSTTTTNYEFIKPELSDPADITATNPNWNKLDTKLKEVDDNFTAEAEYTRAKNKVYSAVGEYNSFTGMKYTITAPSVTELYAGLQLTIIPDIDAQGKYVNIKLNDFSSVFLLCPSSLDTGTATYGTADNWIRGGYPLVIIYDGNYWRVLNIVHPYAETLSGQVSVEHGGTGADNAEDARNNLGAEKSGTAVEKVNAHNVDANAHKGVFAPAYTYGTTDLEVGVSQLDTGKLYFVYE